MIYQRPMIIIGHSPTLGITILPKLSLIYYLEPFWLVINVGYIDNQKSTLRCILKVDRVHYARNTGENNDNNNIVSDAKTTMWKQSECFTLLMFHEPQPGISIIKLWIQVAFQIIVGEQNPFKLSSRCWIDKENAARLESQYDLPMVWY